MTKPPFTLRSVVAAIAATGLLVLTGCSGSSGHWQGSSGGGGAPQAPVATGVITVTPAANSKDVAPVAPVVVTATEGAKVTAVSVTAGSTTISGTLAADGTTWTSTTALKFNTKYTVKVTGADSAGTAKTSTSTFTTVKPARTLSPSLWTNALIESVSDTETYGVGQPVIIHFNHAVPKADRAAVEAALHVESTPAVDGQWHWVDNQDIHYRGQQYWAAHSVITVTANLYGVKLDDGTYTTKNLSATLHIGDSHVAIADNKAHQMKVYINDKLVKTIPVSMGNGHTIDGGNGNMIDMSTRNGPHVVINKEPFHMMSSASYGLVDKTSPYYYAPEKVFDAVRISYTGEFVHLRTWTVGDIGVRNTSHGCINVGDGNAQYMYSLLVPGDIVTVVNSDPELEVTDGLGDWTLPWSQW